MTISLLRTCMQSLRQSANERMLATQAQDLAIDVDASPLSSLKRDLSLRT